MRLYHGTTEEAALKAMEQGLKPRSFTAKKSNWRLKSRDDAVYLTDAYALYFAIGAYGSRKLGRLAVIEVETDRLPLWNLTADEDALEQVGRGRDGLPNGWSMRRRTAHYRRSLEKYCDGQAWQSSLRVLGNCAYLGIIGPDAITRVAFIDPKKQQGLVWQAIDPTITLRNYLLVGHRYRSMLAWTFGDAAPAARSDIDAIMTFQAPPVRDGITVAPGPAYEDMVAA